jgi:hypothetical protein
LHGQLGQQLDSLPVVANRERLEAEHRLQLDQVLASALKLRVMLSASLSLNNKHSC